MTDQDKIDAVTVALNGHNPHSFYPPYRTSKGRWTIMPITGKNPHSFKHEEDARRFYKTGVALNYDADL